MIFGVRKFTKEKAMFRYWLKSFGHLGCGDIDSIVFTIKNCLTIQNKEAIQLTVPVSHPENQVWI